MASLFSWSVEISFHTLNIRFRFPSDPAVRALPLNLIALCMSGICPSLLAAVVQTNFSTENGSVPGYAVSSTDLLQTALSSASRSGSGDSFFYDESGGNTVDLSRLSDGDFGRSGGAPEVSVMPNHVAITFALDLALNPGGYSITSIRTFAGWDDGRDGQQYTVSYSTAATPNTFDSLIAINLFNAVDQDDDGINDAHTLVELTDTSGTLAVGVAQLRFTFSGVENDGTGFREFDVFGAPTAVPEPGVFATVAGAGLLGFALWRKRCSAKPGGSEYRNPLIRIESLATDRSL